MVTKPEARASSSDYLRRFAAFQRTPGIRPGWFTVLRHFASFAENLLDKMLLWSGLFKTDRVEFNGQELMVAQMAAQRGGLLICSHLGNLDLCRVLSKRVGLKLTVLVHTKHAEIFNRLLAQLDPQSQLNLMQVTEVPLRQPSCYPRKSGAVNSSQSPAIAFPCHRVLGSPRPSSLERWHPLLLGPTFWRACCVVQFICCFRCAPGARQKYTSSCSVSRFVCRAKDAMKHSPDS